MITQIKVALQTRGLVPPCTMLHHLGVSGKDVFLPDPFPSLYTVLAAPPPHFLLDRQKKLDQHLTMAISCNGESQGRARCPLYPGTPCPRAALHSQGVMLMVCLAASSAPGPPAARICCTITLAHSFLPWQDRPELNFSIETSKQRLCFFPP